MKKLIIIINMLSFTIVAQAQKAEIVNDKIVVDGKEIAAIEKDGCEAFSPSCTYYVRNSEKKTLITIIEMDFIDPSEKNQGNPEGKVWYLRFSFADGKGVAEVPHPSLLPKNRAKGIASIIAKAQLIKDDQLDENEVQSFIQMYGTHFSDRRKSIEQKVIIIH